MAIYGHDMPKYDYNICIYGHVLHKRATWQYMSILNHYASITVPGVVPNGAPMGLKRDVGAPLGRRLTPRLEQPPWSPAWNN